jgi:hypothetical protein
MKGNKIEEINSEANHIEKIESESTIEQTVEVWKKEISNQDSKTKEELLQDTCKNLAELNDLETRLNEHRAVESHIARHGTADNRRRMLLLHRSEIREKTSLLMRKLKNLGMSEMEMYEQLPFVGKCEIQQLIENQP